MTGSVDLNPNHLGTVKAILAEHVPECEVRAFGSRATWTAKDYSDLDLAVVGEGPLDWRTLDRLKEAFEESDLPMRVDVLDWHNTSESFREVIEREYEVLQQGPVEPTVRTEQSTMTLDDVVDIVMGQSPPGDTVSPDDGVALLNGPTEFGAHHPTPAQYTTDARKLAQAGDLLFCVRGSTTGRMNWADQEYAIGRGVAAIRHRHDLSLQPFVRGVIEVELPELLTRATGSTFPNVSARQLAEIPYPSLSETEQRAIAHVLGTLDDKIELNRRMNETLEGMARALFKSWFVDFEPVRAKMEGRWRRGESLPGMPAELYDLFPGRLVETELGEVPEGWGVRRLSSFGKIVTGKTPSTRNSTFYGTDVPFLRIPDMHGRMYAVKTGSMLSNDGATSQSRQALPSGSISVSCIATPGLVILNHRKTHTNQQINSIVPNDMRASKYLYWWCRQMAFEIMTGGSGGSVFHNMNKSTFSAIEILDTDIRTICAFEEQVSPLHAMILSNEKQSQHLAAQRDALLPRLVSGRLGVGWVKRC